MASINYAAREINVKIVYYGPGLSGKTTNLQVIHRKVPPEFKSDMVSLATETDRTLFFDFLPLDLGKIKGFATKFQLYTVPGQVYYNATRKLVLRGVDGVVFVADSGQDKIEENLESFQNLEDNLAEYGYKRESIPIIIQYNKRDLPNALSVEELQQYVNKYNLPWSEAVANKGVGVFDSLKLIGKIVIDYLNKKYSRGGTRAPSGPAPVQQAAPQQPPLPPRPPVRPAAPAMPPYQQQQTTPGYNQLGQQPMMQPPPSRPAPMQPPPGMAPPQNRNSFPPQQPMRNATAPGQPPMMRPTGMPSQQQPPAPIRQQQPQQHFVPPPPQPYQGAAYADLEQMQQMPAMPPMQRSQPQQRMPMQQPQVATPVDEYHEHTFEPPVAAPARHEPEQQEDYYSYGSINLEPMANQQPPAMNLPQNDGFAGFGQTAVPPPPQQEYNTSGGKTDLDLEIERYQREIEEKQRRGGRSAPAGQQQMPPAPGGYQQQQMQPPAANQQAAAHQDYDVYNMEVPAYGNQPQQQQQQPILGAGEEEEMFFTSVDTDRQKKPIKRPINPRTQQQKGFLSKFFNKDMPG
jgi:signal recognition particle receptor subunit beta